MKTGSVSKFIFAASLALAIVWTNNPWNIAIAIPLAGSALILWSCSLRPLFEAVRLMVVFIVIIFILHLFSHEGEELFSFFGLRATVGGAEVGLFYGAKFVVFVLCAYIIIKAVDPFELVRPIERVAGHLGRFGRPLSFLALSFSLALRFLPELTRQTRLTSMALKSRGVDWDSGLFKRIKGALMLFPAVFVNAFKASESAALAFAVKGYSTRYARAVFPPVRVSIAGISLVIISLGVLILGWRS